MKRLFIVIPILACTALCVSAQSPASSAAAPVPIFSAKLIESYTPVDNPETAAKAKLGDKIFDDKRLSVDGSVACNTCHSPRNGFTTHTATSRGAYDQLGKRNAPSILNAMFFKTMFWDGRAESLEEQAKLPILNPVEMGQKSPADVVAKLSAIPEYVDAFEKVFGRPVNWDDISRALAAFERTHLSTEAPFDRYVHGDNNALNAAQRRGWELFNGKAHCTSCHTYDPELPIFGDNQFHNIGVASRKQNMTQLVRRASRNKGPQNQAELDKLALETDNSELGRFLVTKRREDIGAFKTPFLRDVLLTGPYMHDGSMETLWDVVEYFNRGGEPNSFLDAKMKPLGLTDSEVDDLVSFLSSLTSDRYSVQRDAELDRQRASYLYRRAVERASR